MFEQNAMFDMESMETEATQKTLAERFLVPPFSVLDARQGYWAERKNQWLQLGIQSELGRDDQLTYIGGNRDVEDMDEVSRKIFEQGGNKATSVFDPVLCEFVYRNFSRPGDKILDPFAGGSVRGIVAGYLERDYIGIDLNAEQIAANRVQLHKILGGNEAFLKVRDGDDQGVVRWLVGDSTEALYQLEKTWNIPGGSFDLAFTCPPYGNLEKYTDDPRDLSNMSHRHFLENYGRVIRQVWHALKDNSWFVVVVGDFRDKNGNLRNFVSDTIRLSREAGFKYYNEVIYVTPIGSLAIRAGRQFEISRKFGKGHQNILFFVKGDPRAICDAG